MKKIIIMALTAPSYCGGNANCRDISISAAWYGQSYFLDGAERNYSWAVLPNVSNTMLTNCSGLAYKCYRYGAGFTYKIEVRIQGMPHYIVPSTITPTEIFNSRVHNGFSAMYKF